MDARRHFEAGVDGGDVMLFLLNLFGPLEIGCMRARPLLLGAPGSVKVHERGRNFFPLLLIQAVKADAFAIHLVAFDEMVGTVLEKELDLLGLRGRQAKPQEGGEPAANGTHFTLKTGHSNSLSPCLDASLRIRVLQHGPK